MLTKESYVDFDEDEFGAVLLTYGGQKVALTRERLLGLLALEAGGSVVATGVSRGRSLKSLGKLIGVMRNARKDALTIDDSQRLIAALKEFDGDVRGRRTAQAGRWLLEISSWKTSPADLRKEIAIFLDRYPGLLSIPLRRPR